MSIKHAFTADQLIQEGCTTQEAVDLTKAWLANQNFPQLTDEQIALFLHSCNNDQAGTQSTIKSYYSVRKKSPELFDNRNLQRADFQQYLKTGEVCVLPERTEDGCAVILNRLRDPDYRNYQIGAHFALLSMTVDTVLYEHPPKGLILLLDMQKICLMHMTKIRLGLLKVCFQYLQEGLPVQLKNIHMLNCVYFLDKLMALVKPISRREVLEKMHFHAPGMNMETFYQKWVPKSHLPEDYGGDLPPVCVLHQKNIERLANMQRYFEEEERQRHSVD